MNRTLSKLSIASLIIATLALSASLVQAEQCFSIIVGKDASANGYVMMGHNEDNGPPLAVNNRKISRQSHEIDEIVTLVNGGQLNQVEQTWAYIWSEIPGEIFSDAYVNEWGVCIASDKCPSKEDQPELTDGGISYMFRQIIAQRAQSARDGVNIGAELIERFGYNHSGRSYAICDPDEGWVFCAIYGKNWLAQRVPDDQVAVIANSYTVRTVDLTDTNHFMASEGLIEYAHNWGWYNPKIDGEFDFVKAFADSEHAGNAYNLCRQWGGLRHLTASKVELGYDMPFSIKPDHELEVADMFNILRDHYEGTKVQELPEKAANPHENKYHTICNDDTYNSFVVELRKDMPLDIGIVYWMCLGNPCSSFYIPFHFGINQFPEGYFTLVEKPTEDYFIEKASLNTTMPEEVYWRNVGFTHWMLDNFNNHHKRFDTYRRDFELQLIIAKADAEKTALDIYGTDKSKATQVLENFFTDQYEKSYKVMEAILSSK